VCDSQLVAAEKGSKKNIAAFFEEAAVRTGKEMMLVWFVSSFFFKINK
jgi:hypothetical protein